MNHAYLPLRAQRTLILGLGDEGGAVVRACRRRLQQRWGAPEQAAFLAVQAAPGTTEPAFDGRELLPLLRVPTGAGALTRREALQALQAAAPALVAALVEQLTAITRIPARHQRSRATDEISVYLVAALDDPLGGAALADVAYLVRYLVRQRLNAASQVAGLGLLPDPLLLADPAPAMARAYATLRELEATLRPHDGHRLAWDGLPAVDSWGPSLDQGCYLIAGLNGNGLGLARPGERLEAAGEMLLQLAVAPLGACCASPTLASWGAGAHSSAYASLGVAAWVYPAAALSEALALRIAGDLLAAWSSADAGPIDGADLPSAAAVLLADAGLERSDLLEALLPAAELEAAGLWQDRAAPLAWSNVARYRQVLDDGLGARLEPLAGQRPELDQRARRIGRSLRPALLAKVNGLLDDPAAGNLAVSQAYLAALSQRLADLLAAAQATADRSWQAMEALDGQLQTVGETLDRLSSQFPRPTGRQLLALALSPWRVWRLAQAWQELQRQSAAYRALQAGYLQQGVAVLRHDLLAQTYQEAEEAVGAQQQRIGRLAVAVAAAQERLAAATPPALYGALGYALEVSVLTQEAVAALCQETRGSLPELLAHVAGGPEPLSGWPGADSDGEDVAGVYLDLARARCRGLARVSFDRLLSTLVGQEPRRRIEALQALAAAASPFLAYDETRLDHADAVVVYSCTALGLPEPATANPGVSDRGAGLDGLEDLQFAQVAAGGEADRLTALAAVYGLPLSALPLLDEFAAAYRGLDPAALHVADSWAGLPDPLPVAALGEAGAGLSDSDPADNEEVADHAVLSLP